MKIKTLALAFAVGTAMTGTANAAYTFNLAEVGGNTVVTGTGSVNLEALTLADGTYDDRPSIQPSLGAVGVGAGGYDVYRGITGPSSFGSSGRSTSWFPRSPRGLMILGSTNETIQAATGTEPGESLLLVPYGYTSKTDFGTSSATYNGTFAQIGLIAGTYIYTWGSGADADSMTVNIGPIASAVPEPSTWAMLLVGFGLIGATARYRRRHSTIGYA